jgi:hypothetical protein
LGRLRRYLKTCWNIFGIVSLVYFIPLMLAVLDIRVLKTNLLRNVPWFHKAFVTLYQPFLGEE